MADRYAATGPEGEFEPGSRRRVLRNLLGIRSVREMERVESVELVSATRKAIDETRADQRFTTDHIRYLHRMWLERVYPWAGEYRTVNLSKDAFPFAAAEQVPRLMRELERGPLRRFTPCRLPPLDFSGVHGRERRRYFDAVHAAIAGDLRPMIAVFDQIMTRTLKKRRP